MTMVNYLCTSFRKKEDRYSVSGPTCPSAVPSNVIDRSNDKITNYVERESAILNVIRGRKVLHLGCVGFTDLEPDERVAMASRSLHWTLSQVADVVGIDSAEDVVREYERLGIFKNILVGDVTRIEELRLTAKFNVILVGDILEHVSNPGSMLDGLRGLCNSETRHRCKLI
jgi:2-polyprenyl-3-methyl-5-hydroxy-6-metoxy-1,4-benzoquinol methylase